MLETRQAFPGRLPDEDAAIFEFSKEGGRSDADVKAAIKAAPLFALFALFARFEKAVPL